MKITTIQKYLLLIALLGTTPAAWAGEPSDSTRSSSEELPRPLAMSPAATTTAPPTGEAAQATEPFITTRPIVAPTAHFDRGIRKSIFIPKGLWFFGGNFSYSDYGLSDYKFLILDNLQAEAYTMNLSPFVGFAVADNVGIGGRFSYRRTLIKLDNIDLSLGEDLSFGVQDFYSLQHTYYGTLLMRNYLNLGESKRFGLFNEVQFTAGGGQGKILSGTGEELTGTYQQITELQLGLAPGLAAFITNDLAVEVSVGVLGLNYTQIRQVTDQIYEGNYTRSSANFRINLFSITLGMSLYLPLGKPSTKPAE